MFVFPHSENYLVKWSSSGLVKDIDQLHNLRAVFTVSVFASVCDCMLACCAALFIRPCYEACGSLFVESVFVELSQDEASRPHGVYRGSHLYLMGAQGRQGQFASTGRTRLGLERVFPTGNERRGTIGDGALAICCANVCPTAIHL